MAGEPAGAQTPLSTVCLSGTFGGLVISTLTCPQTRVKVVQQLHGGPFLGTAAALARERSLYRGFGAEALFNGSSGPYLVFYVQLKRALAEALGMDKTRGSRAENSGGADDVSLPLWARSLAGAGANIFTW